MKNIIEKHRILASCLSVIISVFLVSIAVYAATTIGTNINTGGTLDVTGVATLSTASTSGSFWLGNVTADDDDYLYFDASGTEYMMWDDSPGEFDFSDDVNITGQSTSSISIWVGSGGTATNINMAGGDLYVQNDAEIDGALYVAGFISTASSTVDANLNITGNATSTNATTTNAFYAGGDITTAGEITSTGSTTASIINMTTIKFTPAATPTPVVTGECFIDNTDYQLNCYNGTAWQYVW